MKIILVIRSLSKGRYWLCICFTCPDNRHCVLELHCSQCNIWLNCAPAPHPCCSPPALGWHLWAPLTLHKGGWSRVIPHPGLRAHLRQDPTLLWSGWSCFSSKLLTKGKEAEKREIVWSIWVVEKCRRWFSTSVVCFEKAQCRHL